MIYKVNDSAMFGVGLLLQYPEYLLCEFRVLAFGNVHGVPYAKLDVPQWGKDWFKCQDLDILNYSFDEFASWVLKQPLDVVQNLNWF